jgi:hypothetical protein
VEELADFEGKSFSPKGGDKGIRELEYNHPASDKPILIKDWPHEARDPYEQNFLENYSRVKVEGSSKGKSSSGNPAEGAGPAKEEQKEAK